MKEGHNHQGKANGKKFFATSLTSSVIGPVFGTYVHVSVPRNAADSSPSFSPSSTIISLLFFPVLLSVSPSTLVPASRFTEHGRSERASPRLLPHRLLNRKTRLAARRERERTREKEKEKEKERETEREGAPNAASRSAARPRRSPRIPWQRFDIPEVI